MVNKELLKNTLDLINAKPETHDQSNWVLVEPSTVCGTTMCFAGHAAVLAGVEIPDPKKHEVADWYVGKNGEYLNWKQADKVDFSARRPVAEFARDALGLNSEQADYLFGPELDREDLEEAVNELLNDEPISRMGYDEDEDDYDDYDGCACCDY